MIQELPQAVGGLSGLGRTEQELLQLASRDPVGRRLREEEQKRE
jgi:hypothetical protein